MHAHVATGHWQHADCLADHTDDVRGIHPQFPAEQCLHHRHGEFDQLLFDRLVELLERTRQSRQ